MPLFKRILAEKRSLVLPLVIGLALNGLIYVLVTYPLSRSLSNARMRSEEAAQKLQLARVRHDMARNTSTNRDKASDALKQFYEAVLPTNLTFARRMTTLRLAQLAERANLRYERGTVREEHDEDSRLARLRLNLVLAGSYNDVRRFIYQLETAPEFVVIEHVALAQGQERSSPLVLNLEVSTYYRTGVDGV